MRVLFDTSVLLLAINPDAPAPPVEEAVRNAGTAAERMAHLIEQLEAGRATVLVPAPVLTELMIKADGAVAEALEVVMTSRYLQVAPFDQVAAIECGLMMRDAIPNRRNRSKAKVKFDCQIAAIAKVQRVSVVYTDDGGIRELCRQNGLSIKGVWDLAAPPRDPQHPLPFIADPQELADSNA